MVGGPALASTMVTLNHPQTLTPVALVKTSLVAGMAILQVGLHMTIHFQLSNIYIYIHSKLLKTPPPPKKKPMKNYEYNEIYTLSTPLNVCTKESNYRAGKISYEKE